jgi:tripartite-type tricarboxylate transporter receptor subunit TctC
MISRRTAICLAVIGLSTTASIASVSAADYPTRPVRWVVGYPPGGATDIIARLIGQRLSERLGQQFVIENKPGAGNNIATESVINAEPDGYTVLLVNPANYINASLYANLKFNLVRDIAPIAAFNRVPNVMTVNKDVPAKTVAEFIAYVKANPGKVNMASSGNGTSVHLSGEMFMAMSGAKMQHVPYRGAAPAITDLIGGHMQMMIVSIGLVAQPWQSGALNVLGFGSTARIAQYPAVPTLAESGLPGYEAGSWYGLAAPKGTPPEIVGKLNAQAQRIFDDPTFRDKFLTPNFIFPIVSSPDAFAERIRRESEKWGKVIRDANVRVE